MNGIRLTSTSTGESWALPILFEDEFLLALDKPSRLLTSPDRYDPRRPNLMELLHREIESGAGWARQRGVGYLSNTNRLGFETSGVILLAKQKSALVSVASQFGSNKPLKTYVALAQGAPPESMFTVEAKLRPDTLRPGFMWVDAKKGKTSKTTFTVRERFQNYSLLECQPWTDRTHQIRIHLRHAGYPLVGDESYGGQFLYLSQLKRGYRTRTRDAEKPLLGRVALHAKSLALQHPATGEPMEIVSPWPNDLTVAVKYLRRYCVG